MFRFEQQVLSSVREHGLLCEHDRVLVAVSGGPDSVALLHLLCAWKVKLKLSLTVIHINHGLRGAESETDASFVESLCQQLAVPCLVQRLNLQEQFETRKASSIQAVARELRYEAFTQAVQQYDLTKVALGHTRDDQAETVLMWMLRGAGAAGLSGMPAFRAPYFIRPLLGVSRGDVERYLRQNQWTYRIDSSNASLKYQRNRIRQELIPVLKQFNPRIVEVLTRQGDILRDESEYLDLLAAESLGSMILKADDNHVVFHRDKLSQLHRAMQRRVVLLIYQRLTRRGGHPRFDFVEEILELVESPKPSLILQSHGIRVYRDYEKVHVCTAAEETRFNHIFTHSCQALSVPGSICWSSRGGTLEACVVDGLPEMWKNDPSCVYLDADLFTHRLMVRPWEAGDAFYPLGMKGQRKKIQDFFSDMKISRMNRSEVPLVVAPEGIVWVAGFRVDHRFRVRKKTKRFLVLKLVSEFSTSLESGIVSQHTRAN